MTRRTFTSDGATRLRCARCGRRIWGGERVTVTRPSYLAGLGALVTYKHAGRVCPQRGHR